MIEFQERVSVTMTNLILLIIEVYSIGQKHVLVVWRGSNAQQDHLKLTTMLWQLEIVELIVLGMIMMELNVLH